MDPELARFIGRCGYHAPLGRVAASTDHHRPTFELWTAQQLHGSKEGVHVDVKNAAGLSHARDCLAVQEWFKASAAVALSYCQIGITEVSK